MDFNKIHESIDYYHILFKEGDLVHTQRKWNMSTGKPLPDAEEIIISLCKHILAEADRVEELEQIIRAYESEVGDE